ncbi:MAG: PilZ domain-containing protein [Colwellia sp.]|nr:PilZ domain-containing protein [Colwellia sp.]
MTTDFSKYQKIVEQFRGNVLKTDFETNFAAMTQHIPKTERFLLKMELKRLAAPCTRLVDLRGHVDGECRAYQHNERTHFLDDTAIRTFDENIVYYKGYTFGVYEAVMNTENNFRVIYQNEKSNLGKPIKAEPAKVFEKTQYPSKLFTFGPYHNRSEERMNFAIAIGVFLDKDNKEYPCTSSDISVNGCKFRFNTASKLSVGQIITIRFNGLEEEFQFGKENTFSFVIKNIQQVDKTKLVGCQRVQVDGQGGDGFKLFLQGFIQGNKRRYKVNLDNSINAIQSRSFEQFCLPKLNELPIFIEDNGRDFFPRYALTCNNNQSVYQYWQDENRHSALYCLITKDRITRMNKAKALGKDLLVYSFIHRSQGKHYFYTADDQQLNDDAAFKKQFLGFASSKVNFAITQLSLINIDVEKSESPFTLSNTLTKKNQYLNLPVPNDVMETLYKLPYIVVANDITSKLAVSQYQQLSFDKIETARLKNFGHKRLTTPLVIDDVGINYNNQRQEPRFKYKTPAELEIEGIKCTGKSHDFSILGLKLELDKPSVLNKGDVVYLTFPALQKITSAFELKALPYEVIRINKQKTVLNLRVYVEKHQHMGRAFFKALIHKNRDKLTPDEYALMIPGLAKALRNIYSSSLTIPSLMVQTSGSRYKLEALVCGEVQGKLLPVMKELSDRSSFYNLYPLLNNLQATNSMTSSLKKIQVDDSPITEILYIAINLENEMVDQAVTTKLASELQSTMLQRMFISRALNRGLFFCVQAKLSRTAEPDMDHLNPELSYISSYAIHRGKQIEQDIWSVSGVIQLLDITQETLTRHELLA